MEGLRPKRQNIEKIVKKIEKNCKYCNLLFDTCRYCLKKKIEAKFCKKLLAIPVTEW